MFQFLILTIFVLFGAVELFQWLKGVMLPLPIYVLAGAFLAIASNYDRGMGLLFNQAPLSENLMQKAVIIEPEPMVLTAESMESVATQETKIGKNEVD
jgi:hypothetical protein